MKKRVTPKAPFQRIVWGVDALNGDLKIQRRTAKAIASLTKGTRCTIEPVCIVSPPDARLVRKGYGHVFEEDAKKIQKNLKKLVKAVPLKGLKPVTVRQPRYSTSTAVKAFLAHAKKKKADLIVLSTHAREGLSRFFMGSFAETVFLHSGIPVFVVNPKSKMETRFKNVFFPTDFSDSSIQIFSQVLGLAKSLKAKVTIYHKVEYSTGRSNMLVYENSAYGKFMEEDLERRRELGEKLRKSAEAAGVKADVIIDEKNEFIEVSILKAAKKAKAEVIAMASQSGAFTSALLGSITRKIVRMSHCPVWVLHPKPVRKKKSASTTKERVKEEAAKAETWVRAVGIR